MKIIFTLFACTLSFSAWAHEDGPCAKDRAAYCATVKPGGGRMMECMKQNEAKLSPECKAFRAKAKEEMQDVATACHDDAASLCPNLEKKELKHCLHEKRNQLSPGCKAEMKEMHKELKEMKKKNP